MTPGSIVWFQDFEFHDGATGTKYLIVLNNGLNRPYLVVKTTSQRKYRPNREGCHSDASCYFLPAKRAWFPSDTWVILDEPYELDSIKFLKAKFDGRAEIKGELSTDLNRAIINCFSRTDDCSPHHLFLLK